MFAGMDIQITSAGRPYLGAPIDSQDFITDFTQNCVSQWVQGLSQLSSITVTQPDAAYAVLVHGFSSKWNYYLRTNPNINDQLHPLELAICLILKMLCVYTMAGSHHTYLLTVFAAKPLSFLTLSAACTVLFPSSTIMMYKI